MLPSSVKGEPTDRARTHRLANSGGCVRQAPLLGPVAWQEEINHRRLVHICALWDGNGRGSQHVVSLFRSPSCDTRRRESFHQGTQWPLILPRPSGPKLRASSPTHAYRKTSPRALHSRLDVRCTPGLTCAAPSHCTLCRLGAVSVPPVGIGTMPLGILYPDPSKV